MNSLRLARSAVRAAPSAFRAAPALRRGYADVASDKIQLTLALPHQAIYKSKDVYVLLCMAHAARSHASMRPPDHEH